jgi:outer membrane protein
MIRLRVFSLLSVICMVQSVVLASEDVAPTTQPANSTDLKSTVNFLRLEDYLAQVIKHNDAIQAQLLEAGASQHKARAEYGAFEPQLEASASREANRRTNNVQQQASQNSDLLFDERNDLYDAGLETLLPVGGKVRLGYTVSDLYNNVNPYSSVLTSSNAFFTKQFQTFVGLTLTQPLLKGAGWATTMAPLRLAAMDSDIAYQQYRRQLMLTVSRAESAYWNLYYAQEQLDFFDESVKVSQELLNDTRQKSQAGQGSDLDVMEAQSGLAVRQAKRNEALQDYYDAIGNLLSLTGQAPAPGSQQAISSGAAIVRAADRPAETNLIYSYEDGMQDVLKCNPDYLVLSKKVEEQQIRVDVARNQMYPELDFKGAYGYSGLAGSSAGDSMDALETGATPSWSVGLELSMPIFGDIKDRNLYKAARLALSEESSNLRDTQNQIANHLDLMIQKTRTWQESIQSYQTVVHFNEELLKTQSERLKAGTIDAYKLLEVEADLLDSRQQLANALVQYQRSLIDCDLTTGAILRNHDLEISRDELKRETARLLED